jgi:hypothetical protein
MWDRAPTNATLTAAAPRHEQPTAWDGSAWLRLSAHAYNHPAEYEALAAGLPDLLSR